jgi:toxin ParE1/3/4
MGWKVIIAPQAIGRLEEIVRFIAEDDPHAAERLGHRLLDRVELLADFPELGRPYLRRKHVRRLSCPPYAIYYRVQPESQVVEIMDFWHGSRLDPQL